MLVSVYNKYHNTEKKYIIYKKKGVGDFNDRREKADPNTNKKSHIIKDGVNKFNYLLSTNTRAVSGLSRLYSYPPSNCIYFQHTFR